MSKIRRSARGQDCQVRIPLVCSFDPETVVLAHKNGGGMGMKNPDYLAAYCCDRCHSVIDGRVRSEYSADEIAIMFYEGIFRTQMQLFEAGILKT